jgi:ABC-2 type transport system ATP-binding protein
VAKLLAAASRDRVTLRTAARAEAMAVLTGEGATVTIAGHDTVTISGLPAQRIAELLGQRAVPFSELAAHHASLEEAYMELTRDAVEFHAMPAGQEA